MANILKGIYKPYGYKETTNFIPNTGRCSKSENALKELIENAPESADTLAEIASILSSQAGDMASANTYTDEQVQKAKDELSSPTQANADAIAAEVSARTAAVADLQAKIDEVSASTSSADMQEKIDAEASARTVADAELQAKIDEEAARAKAAEEVNASTVEAEKTERQKADDSLSKSIDALLSYIKLSEDASASKVTGSANIVSDEDVVAYGIYKNDSPAETKISGKAVTVKSLVGENSRLNIAASGKTVLDGVNLSGNLPKSLSNAQISVNNGDGNDVEINGGTMGQTSYNCIEIGLASDSIPSNVVVDGVDFDAALSNNAILVFGVKDNGTITVKNCHFKSVSNVLRFSNKANATGVTINIENCTVDQWDSNPEWAGFFIMEDYTSKDTDAESANNLFGDGKITVNLNNVVWNGTKITGDNIALGAKTADTFAYVYYDKTGYISYAGNESRYPTFNVK